MRRFLVAAAAAIVLVVGLPADATVNNQTRSVQYTGSGGTTFTVTFPFLAADWLRVTKTTIATGAAVILTKGTDYSVTLPVGTSNGSITTTSSISSSYTITIERVVPLTQTSSLRSQGAFDPRTIENGLDKLTMIAQQLEAQASAGQIDQTDIDTAITAHEADSDPHVGYALLAGRSGGQTLIGGTAASNNLVLQTSSNATKGKILMGSSGTELVVDDVNNRVGIGTASPSYSLDNQASGGTRLGTTIIDSDGDVFKTTTSNELRLGAGSSAVTGNTTPGIVIRGPTNGSFPNDLSFYGKTFKLRDVTSNVAFFTHDIDANLTTIKTDLMLEGGSSVYLYGGSGVGADLNLESTSNASKGNINFGTASTYDEANTRLGIGDTTPDVALDVVGDAIFSGTINGLRKVVAGGGSHTVVVPDDCGSVITTATDSAVIQLPDAATDNKGCQVTVINTGADGAALVSISPHSSDGIYGSCTGVTGAGAATVVQFSGTANKDINNTKATANKGDHATIVSDGTSGWYVIACVGEWASSP